MAAEQGAWNLEHELWKASTHAMKPYGIENKALPPLFLGSTPVAKLTALDRPVARRPKVGMRTSPPVRYSSDAFRPLNAGELQEWGL